MIFQRCAAILLLMYLGSAEAGDLSKHSAAKLGRLAGEYSNIGCAQENGDCGGEALILTDTPDGIVIKYIACEGGCAVTTAHLVYFNALSRRITIALRPSDPATSTTFEGRFGKRALTGRQNGYKITYWRCTPQTSSVACLSYGRLGNPANLLR